MEVYVRRGEEQFGPFTPKQIKESLSNGALIEGDLAWHSDLTEWVPADEVLASSNSVAKSVEETAPDTHMPSPKSDGRNKIVIAMVAGVILLGAAASIVLPKVLAGGEDKNPLTSMGTIARVSSDTTPSSVKPSTPSEGTADKTDASGTLPPDSAVQPQFAPPPALPVVMGDSTNTFAAVTKHLDSGGTFFFYLSTQQVQNWMQTVLNESGEFLGQLAPDLGQDAEMVPTGFGIAKSLYNGTGLDSIDGIGVSTKEIEDGLKRNVAIIHHDPARGDGVLWKAFGSAPHDIAAMKLMPAETAYAMHSDLDLSAIQAWLKIMIANNAPDLVPVVDKRLKNPLLQDILGSYDGEIGLYVTLDPAKPIEMPAGGFGEEGISNSSGIVDLGSASLPDAPPPLPSTPPSGVGVPSLPPLPPGVEGANTKFPPAGLILTLKVRNDDIQVKIQETLAELGAPMKSVDVAGVSVHQMPELSSLSSPFQLTLFKLGDYLIITSSPELAAKVIAVNAGADAGLQGTEEFRKLSRGMKIRGNQFSYVSSRISGLFGDVIKQSMAAQGEEMIPARLKELIIKFSTIGMNAQVSIMEVTSEGYLMQTQTEGMGYDAAAMVLGAGAPMLMGASLAVPAFIGGGFAAEENPAAEMEAKFSQGRILAAGLMRANQTNGQFPNAETWSDELLKIVRDPKQFVDPVMVNPLNPDERICTWLFNKHLSGAKLEDLSTPQDTVLIFAAESLEWNGAGDNADYPVDIGDVITVFADGHVATISKADLPRLKWKP
jgi:hypothetical protein